MADKNKLWSFRLPKERELVPNEQVVLLREVDTDKSGDFAPPKDFAVQGNIVAPGVTKKEWCTNLCEIVALGSKVSEQPGWRSERPLKVGQWVIHRGASPFFFLGQKYFACVPEFVVAIAKEPETSSDSLYDLWERRGEPESGAGDDNVVSMAKKREDN